MSKEQKTAYLNEQLGRFLQQMEQLKDEHGEQFQLVFNTLPPRSNIAYYKLIQRPMSYSKIRKAIKGNKYITSQQFVKSIAQIVWNAHFFNEESTEYYKWATVLDDFLKDTVLPALRRDVNIVDHETVSYPMMKEIPSDPRSRDETIREIEEEQKREKREQQERQQKQQEQQQKLLLQRQLQQQQMQQQGFTNSAAASQSLPGAHPGAQLGPNAAETDMSVPDFSRAAQPRPSQHALYQNLAAARKSSSTKHSSLPNYNPAAYRSQVEQNEHPNVYNPPRITNTGIPNRKLLEQWVKRGRPPIVDKPHEQRIKSIMRGLKKIKVKGKTIIAVFDKLPNQQEHPEFYDMIKDPVSMLDIKGLIKQRYYKTVDAYMADVFRLIANGKKYYSAIGDKYSAHNIELLETNIIRLYHLEMAKPDSAYIGDVESSKIPIPQVVFQGRSYRVGNWVLMRNPNDATEPIPGQIFRIWQEHGKQYMNVCWYYKPEWTTHRYDRLFLENEVFKTGQYRDHPVEDIVGPCYIAYFTRWLKGDPGVKFDGPLFICEFRYNDRELNFAKIRTWKACLPDEVRHIEDPIVPIKRSRVLKKLPSPIKHLLPPGSTASTPIPPPTILNLNAPPLIGGLYVKRQSEDEEVSYFDADLRQDQCELLIPPSVANGRPTDLSSRSHGHRSASSTPHQAFLPSKPSPVSPVAAAGSVLAAYGSPTGQTADRGSLVSPYSFEFQKSLQAGQLGVISMAADGVDAISADTIRLQQLQQQLQLQQQQQQQQQQLQQLQQQQQQLQQQQQEYLAAQRYTPHSYTAGGGHKVIHTPFNVVGYQFLPYVQATSSQAFVFPSSRERAIQKFARQNYEKLDPESYKKFYQAIQKQNYFEVPREDAMVSPEQLDKERADGLNQPGPMLWFKAPPQFIPNRILNCGLSDKADSVDSLNPILKRRRINPRVKTIKLGHSAKYLAWKLKAGGVEARLS